MTPRNLLKSLTFCGLMTIFAAQAFAAPVEIIFKGSEAKMSMNLFKFQLKNKVSDLNVNLKFVATEVEVAYDVKGLKKVDKKKRLNLLVKHTNNCAIIKDVEQDQMKAFIEERDCEKYAYSSETIMAMNSRPNEPWLQRVESNKKVTLVREEMALEANVDSDTAAILSSLAQSVEQEVNFLTPHSSKVELKML